MEIAEFVLQNEGAEVSVNKNGKITGKKKGTGKVTAEVTLKDGTKKTVRMKVKVK